MESSIFLPELVLPNEPRSIDPVSLFASLPEPRQRRGRRYTLAAYSR